MKKCFKCGFTRPLSQFYKHAQMKDGHLNKCITCTKKDVHYHRHESEHREKVLAYDRARGNRQTLKDLQEYRAKYPIKYKAHCAVNNALRSKKITKKPCEICGKEKAHAHHDDYSRPLNVRWLCSEHHHEWHVLNGEGANAF